jgi:hypothetical protein
MAAAKDKPAEEKPCPVRPDFDLVELSPEQMRLLKVRSEPLGVSVDVYHHIFSHGANFARLNA